MTMHESMQRLYQAAETLKHIESKPAKLAKFLEVDHGKVTNWQRRGVSRDGALIAKEKIGCNAGWIVFNEGMMRDGHQFTNEAKMIVEALSLISDDLRESWLDAARKALAKASAQANRVA